MENFIELLEKKLECTDKKKISENFVFIKELVYLFFEQIKVSDVDETNLIFKVLEDIQSVLAKAVFKNKVNVTPELRKFVYDFDRIDDDDMKNYLYSKIKSNDYTLS